MSCRPAKRAPKVWFDGWMVIQAARVALADAAAYPAALEAFRAGLVWPTLIFFAAVAIAVAVTGGPRQRTAAAG